MSDQRIELLFERFRRQGDVEALGQVFDATAPALRRVARHLTRDAAEAEDLVQATFLAAIEKRATFDAAREISPWLTGILLKQASLARRARARAIEPDRLAERTSEDPLDAAANRELSEALTVALARLSPADRDVLIPLLLDGRRAVEIARELGRRPDTVHMRIHRGLARLRQLLPAGIALGVLAKFAGARGLGAVRAEVLRRASVQVQGASLATAGAVTVGIAMSMKKIAVVAALVLVLGIGGYRVATSADGELGIPAVSIGGVGTIADTDARQTPDEHARRGTIPPLDEPSASAKEARELVLAIVRADGSVVVGAPAALVDAGKVVHATRTDASGSCTFAAGSGSGELYVRDDAAFPEHSTVDLAAGRRTIVLAKGSECAGRLVLVGGATAGPIDLELTTDRAPDGLARAQLDVLRALGLVEHSSLELIARTTTDAAGNFRFRVPGADWSGLLRVPRELVFLESGRPTRSHEHVLRVPRDDLEIEIAYLPCVTGRLVDEDGDVFARASADCKVEWANGNGSWMRTTVRSGADGRFAIALDGELVVAELQLLEIRAADGRIARASRSAQWSAPSALFDAGDFVCAFPAARPIEVRVTGPGNVPIAGARGAIHGLDAVTTDEHGVARFGAVPESATELQVVAPGWAVATVEISAESRTPIEVVLAPTNRLIIALPEGTGQRQDLRVDVVFPSNVFGGTRRVYGMEPRVVRGSETFSAHASPQGEIRATFGFAEDGAIVLEGLVTCVPLRVELIARAGRTGTKEVWTSAAVAALGASEQRRIDLVIPDERVPSLHVLRIRVVDEHGRPIADAGLDTDIGRGGGGGIVFSDMDGSMHLDMLGIDETEVEVTKRGYVPFRVFGWDLRSKRVLEAKLVRGRDLRVEIVDANGRPIEGSRLRADAVHSGAPSRTIEEAPGVYVLLDVPEAATLIEVDFAGARYEHVHPGPGDVVRIVLPEHGRLRVAWSLTALRDAAKHVRIALVPTGSVGGAHTETVEGPSGALELEAVLPGEYSIGLESAASSADGSDWVYAPLGEPRRITVVAGETARVEL